MNLDQFIERTAKGRDFVIRPQIICKDGFSMSVQGSDGHYCEPRKNSNFYSKMEIGFPSSKEELIMDFVDDIENPTNTVYGWVPVKIIQAVIEKHGGIDEELTFKDTIKEVRANGEVIKGQ